MNLDFQLIHWLQSGNGMLFGGGLLFLLALFLLARWLGNWLLNLNRRKSSFARKRQSGFLTRLVLLLFIAALMFLATTAIMTGVSMKTYVAFNRVDHVASVECLSWDPNAKQMVVNFSEIRKEQVISTHAYSLFGDQWEVSARIIKWDPRLNLLGLHTAYRLNQIKGSYQEASDEASQPHRAYALAPGQDWVWRLMALTEGRLPLVEAVYGNAVSQMARPGERFDIFVTTSGLSTRREKR